MALRLSVLVLGASCTLLGNGVSLAEPPVAKKEVIVVDAGGKQVGPVIGMNEYFDQAYVLLRVGEITFPAAVGSNGKIEAPTANFASNLGTIYYQSGDCTGQPYLDDWVQRISGSWVAIDRGIAYAPVPGAVAQTLTLLGQRPTLLTYPPYCDRVYKIRDVVPAYELIDLNVAFTPPFTIVSK